MTYKQDCYYFEPWAAPHIVTVEKDGKSYPLNQGLGTYKFHDGMQITLGMNATLLDQRPAAASSPQQPEEK